MHGVLTAVLLKVKVSGYVIPCYLASCSRHSEESWCLHIWGQVLFSACLIQKMKTLQSFKMPQATHTMTKCHIPEDLNRVVRCFTGPHLFYRLEECEYNKTPILHCCILVFWNLFTSCTVLVKYPKNNFSQITCHFRWHIQTHKIGVLQYF